MAVDEDDFGKQLADAFAADLDEHNGSDSNPNQVTPPADDPAQVTPPAPNAEEPKPNENPADPNKKDEEPETPPADPSKPAEGDPAAPKDPETPPAPEEPAAPQPLTRDDVADVIRNMRNEDRISSTAVEDATNDVIEAYHPGGLSNVLVDQTTGKELKTPQDVVDATNGEMGMEQAAQWLLNEQYKLDQNIAKIKSDARAVAETTLTFRNNGTAAVEKYEPLFKAFEKMGLQQRVFDKMMKFVKADEKKGVILSAPDPMEFYDDYLEPYVTAFEHSKQQAATNPVTPPADPAAPPAPAKPTQQDRLDEGGDGGQEEPNNPDDFAQQVTKELNSPW